MEITGVPAGSYWQTLFKGKWNYIKICFYIKKKVWLFFYCFQDSTYEMVTEEDGVGKCPFDPLQNSTAVYTGTLICFRKENKFNSPTVKPQQLKQCRL